MMPRGQLGVIEQKLQIITEKLYQRVFDDEMLRAWSMLTNATDEDPDNCEHFITAGGIGLFLKCKKKFSMKEDFRKMMGSVGNVAEVEVLRPHLMTSEFVEAFESLLDSTLFLTSYKAAKVIALLAMDGPEAWTIAQPARYRIILG